MFLLENLILFLHVYLSEDRLLLDVYQCVFHYYIHLNNYPPDNPIFDSVWDEITIAHNLGIKIVLMMGGSGSAFTDLFNNFDVYYPLLVETIKNHNVIGGIDLDVEEEASIENIKMLIDRLNTDFGKDFIISMAPVQGSLEYDIPGMGGFIYKDLYNSTEGQRINYFNGQFYYDISLENGEGEVYYAPDDAVPDDGGWREEWDEAEYESGVQFDVFISTH